jgi:outer membrane biosynthesis protein TonB
MDATALRREDGLGLGVAVVLHLALMAALLTQAPERLTLGSAGTMTVTLGDGDSEAGSAPALGVPDAPELIEEPVVEQDELVMQPEPRPQPTQRPKPDARPKPQPTQKSQQKKTETPTRKKDPPRTATKGQQDGVKGGTGKSKESVKDAFGDIGTGRGSTAEVKADIKVSIGAQVAPFWNRCRVSGLDIDKLRAVVSFRLDKSGKLAGWDAPRVTGQNASNSAQAGIFGECAVKALRQVGTFTGLPADRYDLWQSYEFEFRKR